MRKIIIVEDDESVAEELAILLKNANYETEILQNFDDAENEILKSNSDLILLDINIPVLNGKLLLKEIRKKSNIPVIMITSCASDKEEATAILYGADDFVAKPYNPMVLLLRIANIFKRTSNTIDIFEYRNLEINLKKGFIKNEDKKKELTKNEMLILRLFLENKNRIVSREEIMTELWNNDEYINDNALTVSISRLRLKFALLGAEDVIRTKIGVGYALV